MYIKYQKCENVQFVLYLSETLARVLCDVAGHMASVSCVAGSEAVMATPVALLSESVLGWSIFTIVLLVRYMNYPL